MQDFAIQNSYSKYSLNDVSIISFTDEKIFTVTTLKNPQNDRLYASTKKKDVVRLARISIQSLTLSAGE